MYDIKKIKSLYSNLDTISFWNINNEIKLLEQRGYSTKEMETKFQQVVFISLFSIKYGLLSAVFYSGYQI